jgi:hypothetical protein
MSLSDFQSSARCSFFFHPGEKNKIKKINKKKKSPECKQLKVAAALHI